MAGHSSSHPITLSTIERVRLIQTLNGLPPPQLEELAFGLNPPSGILPPNFAAQGNRTSVLLQWAEGPTGPGLRTVQEVLSLVAGIPALAPSPNHNIRSLFLAPRRNPFFTGRDVLLSQIERVLKTGEPAALSGLGGIGKTQIAIEYAYRHQEQYTAVLWVKAESEDDLVAGMTALAQDLGLALSQDEEQAVILQAVKDWLHDNEGWLLILDNADHLNLVRAWLSLNSNGHILLTTRASETRPLAEHLEVMIMPPEEGALFLLRRSGQINRSGHWAEATIEVQSLALELCDLMDGLPLALDQAGAYILETPSSLREYLQLYKTAAPQLLAHRGRNALDHPSVVITFSLAIKVASQCLPTIQDFINLCAFLAPDRIPEELFKERTVLNEPLKSVIASPLDFLALLKEAGRFSLIVRNVEEQTFSLHRLVQKVVRGRLDVAIQEDLIQQVVEIVDDAFPRIEFANWPLCDRLLPHAMAATHWSQQYSIETESTARLLNRIATYLGKRVRYCEAKPLYQEALAMRQRLLSEAHPDVATSLNNLAWLHKSQWRYEEAKPLYQEALAMRQQLFGAVHLDVAESLYRLAELNYEQGRYAEAEPLYQEALAMRKQLLGEAHPDVAQSLNNLALLYYHQGRYKEAEPLYQEALAMRKQCLGKAHPDVAQSLSNLASLYDNQGRYAEAEPLYQEALTLYKRLLGETHPNVATSLNNLAWFYDNQGCYGKAEPLYQQALAMRQQLLGKTHPNVAISLNNLAGLYDKQGHYPEAEILYQQALDIMQRHIGDEHPTTTTIRNNLESLRIVMRKAPALQPGDKSE